MEPRSRTTTPNRLGLMSGEAVTTLLEGASVRVGLNRLRAATTLYALPGGRGESAEPVVPANVTARRPPRGSGVGATNLRPMYRTNSTATAASARFTATSVLDIMPSLYRAAE